MKRFCPQKLATRLRLTNVIFTPRVIVRSVCNSSFSYNINGIKKAWIFRAALVRFGAVMSSRAVIGALPIYEFFC